MKRLIVIVMTFALILTAGSAMALTDTSPLTVNATVVGNCRITGTGTISFTNYDPTDSSPNNADGSVTVRCTNGVSYTIYIGTDRTMNSGSTGDSLPYELYSDAARSSVWGSTLAAGEGYASISNAESTKTIYGQIAAYEDVQAAGDYTDTVTITVEW